MHKLKKYHMKLDLVTEISSSTPEICSSLVFWAAKLVIDTKNSSEATPIIANDIYVVSSKKILLSIILDRKKKDKKVIGRERNWNIKLNL